MFVATLIATACPWALAATSIGDRLVLEHEYFKTYVPLPLNIDDATAQAWQVSDICQPGFGQRAEGGSYNHSMHMWYDASGAVMGYGVSVSQGVATPPWRAIDDHFEIDFLFRDPSAACGSGLSAVPGSIGDRLLLVREGDAPLALPLTRGDAVARNFTDAGPCWTDMGYHMVYPDAGASPAVFSPVMPIYTGDGLRLSAMNTPSYSQQQTPPFEHFLAGHGGPAYGLHVYFAEHQGCCGDAPTLPPFPPAAAPKIV